QQRRGVRDHHEVVARLDDGVVDGRWGLFVGVELGQERRTGLLFGAGLASGRGPLDDQRIRRPVVRRRQPDEIVDVLVTAEEFDVVTSHQPALRVPDDRYALRPGAGENVVDEFGQSAGRLPDLPGAAVAVVEWIQAVAAGGE